MKYIKIFELSIFVQKYIIKDFIVTQLCQKKDIDNTGSLESLNSSSKNDLFIMDFYFSELNSVDKENIKNLKFLIKKYTETFFGYAINNNEYDYKLRIIIENDKIDELYKYIETLQIVKNYNL